MKALLYTQNTEETAVLSLLLQQAGLSVRVMRDLERAIAEWAKYPFDFALLTLPEEGAKAVKLVKMLRAPTDVPIVVICENYPEDFLVNLLEEGADLLIGRPYSVRILLAQLKSLIRRSANIPFFSLPILDQGGITLDPSKRTVQVNETIPQHLTQLEFRLLYTLMTHPGQIIPSESLVEQVWEYSGAGSRDLVRGLVQRLRTKVEPDPHKPRYILTESGIGYFFNRYYEE